MPRAKLKGGKAKQNKIKLKTKSACKDGRFKVTGTGKIVKGKIGQRKLLRNKTSDNKRQNSKKSLLAEGFARMVKRCFLHISRKKKNKK